MNHPIIYYKRKSDAFIDFKAGEFIHQKYFKWFHLVFEHLKNLIYDIDN
jgi:hypothetical protein